MIIGLIHPGSGIGNQLHRYVMTRVLAEDRGYKWGMAGWENWKANFIFHGGGVCTDLLPQHIEMPDGKLVLEDFILWEEKTKYYNPEINFINNDIVIDGEFQDERYFEHRLKDIDKWLEVKPLPMPEDLCVINFRGGEFTVFPELFLTKEYWDKAVKMMLEINPKMKFEVHTDDPLAAMSMFPTYEVVNHAETNWRSIRYAQYLILANSSFAILPALLGSAKKIIAPRYWARRNTGVWSMPANYYKRFTYV